MTRNGGTRRSATRARLSLNKRGYRCSSKHPEGQPMEVALRFLHAHRLDDGEIYYLVNAFALGVRLPKVRSSPLGAFTLQHPLPNARIRGRWESRSPDVGTKTQTHLPIEILRCCTEGVRTIRNSSESFICRYKVHRCSCILSVKRSED